jgi:hypothetical protein
MRDTHFTATASGVRFPSICVPDGAGPVPIAASPPPSPRLHPASTPARTTPSRTLRHTVLGRYTPRNRSTSLAPLPVRLASRGFSVASADLDGIRRCLGTRLLVVCVAGVSTTSGIGKRGVCIGSLCRSEPRESCGLKLGVCAWFGSRALCLWPLWGDVADTSRLLVRISRSRGRSPCSRSARRTG